MKYYKTFKHLWSRIIFHHAFIIVLHLFISSFCRHIQSSLVRSKVYFRVTLVEYKLARTSRALNAGVIVSTVFKLQKPFS